MGAVWGCYRRLAYQSAVILEMRLTNQYELLAQSLDRDPDNNASTRVAGNAPTQPDVADRSAGKS